MNFKMLCSDLDGTLLSTKNDVSDFTVSEINRIKEKIKIVLVSARMPQSMTYLQDRMGIADNPIICYNGALILQKDATLSSTVIPAIDVNRLQAICKSRDIKLGLYRHNEWCVAQTSERVEKEIFNTKAAPRFEPTKTTLERWEKTGTGAHKIMLMGTKQSMDALSSELPEEFLENMNFYRSNDTLIEVAPKSVSKLSAIQCLLENHDSLHDVIAFGDNYNDLEMLKNVGFGVAVANAREEVKKIAQKVTLSNTESGVAQFIKDHL